MPSLLQTILLLQNQDGMQLINQIEHKVFDNVSFAGPSWVPETASVNRGELILPNISTTTGESSDRKSVV